MGIHRRVTAEKTAIKISGDFTIYEMEDAKLKLLDNDKGLNNKVQLNLEQLEELDCAGVQLLLMLNRQIDLHGGTLRLVSISDSARQVLQMLCLSEPFSKEALPA